MDKIKNHLFIVAVFILFFCGPAILYLLGWVIDYANAPGYQKLYPSFYIFFGLVGFSFLVEPISILRDKKTEVRLIVVFILLLIFMIVKRETGGFALIINCLMLPVLLSVLLPNTPFNTSKIFLTVKKLILCFFIIECFIAIIERLIGINFFVYAAGEGGFIHIWLWNLSTFRSTSLLGHPLSNALCVSVVMSFILVSNIKDLHKYLLIFLGLTAILCFNTRSSLLAWAVLFPLYILYTTFFIEEVSLKKKIFLISLLIIGFLLALYLIIEFDFSGRIVKNGINDSSAGNRIGIWGIFEHIQFYNLVIGHSSDELSFLMRRAGFYHIENYWLIYLIRFGVIFTFTIIGLFVCLFKKYLNGYSRFERGFLISCFVLLSSTNNSLAVGVPAISFFFVCSIALNPKLSIQKNK